MSNIVYIPSTAPFLDGLVTAILNGDLPVKGGPKPAIEDLSSYTLLLPTRRACRVCGEAFLRIAGSSAIILPTIRPIGDGGEDEGLIHDAISQSSIGSDKHDISLLDMPPAVSKLERHLILTRFILTWLKTAPRRANVGSDVGITEPGSSARITHTNPAQASLMARELTKLMDNAETEQVDLKHLETLVPDEFSEHWQQTLDFLTIVTKQWPAYLENTEQLSQALRRNMLLNKEAERLSDSPPKGPVIIAGSTGSIPAAARLMQAVVSLPNGAIVLPGLDQHLEQDIFKAIVPEHPEHPQFGLAKLISDIDVERADIKPLEGTAPDTASAALITFLSEALRPSSSTEQWQTYISAINETGKDKANLQQALEPLSLSIARDAQEEAELISLILRHTAETPGQTAALVTPDRLLARRVAVRLTEWGIHVDDSGGRPLAKTMPGTFFDQIIQALSSGFEPGFLLSLLKHPLTSLGLKRGESRLAARALEIAALRQPWLGGGLEGVKTAFNETRDKLDGDGRIHPSIRRLRDQEWQLAETLLNRLIEAFTPLTILLNTDAESSLNDFISAHIEVAESLAQPFVEQPEEPPETGEPAEELTDKAEDQSEPQADPQAQTSSLLWHGAAGEQLARLLAEILTLDKVAPPLKALDYPEFYKSLIAGETVRPLTPVHPRLFIWGPFEARLQQPDIVILGGLNEGTWPSAANANPWLSRPMCEQLGLPAPEQHIGYGAHDFASLLCAGQVHLTRAAKTDGVQTVPSRWLMRIEALLKGLELTDTLAPSVALPFARWAALRDEVTPAPPTVAPAPTPPVKARPRQLSVTRIEDWIANPYSIFARTILKLAPLDPLGDPPNAAMKGQIIHEAMQRFTDNHPDQLPDNIKDELTEIAADLMRHIEIHPQVGAFWKPRFERFAVWFAQTEPERRKGIKAAVTEQSGKLSFDAPAGPFTLTARADRIDCAEDGSYHIYDYKTGTVPTPSQVKALIHPQLPLEAAIIEEGGFSGLDKGAVSALTYIAAKGGEPAGKETTIGGDDLSALSGEALQDLKDLVTEFDDPATPYKALRRKDFKSRYKYDDYAHLARAGEWDSAEPGEGE